MSCFMDSLPWLVTNPVQVREARKADIDEIFTIRTSLAENYLSYEQLIEMGITPEAIAAMLAQGPCLWVWGLIEP